jgi:hypothetical protein
MCMSQQLPCVDMKKRLLRNINAVDNAGTDVPDDADVLDAALNDTPLDGDFLRHESRHLKDDSAAPPSPWAPYEQIFTASTGIARREDRPTTNPTPSVHGFVMMWYMWVGISQDQEHELGVKPNNFSRFFKPFIREHLPTKLDLNSWVGEEVMNNILKHGRVKDGLVYQWRPWMGTNEDRSTLPPAGFEFLDQYVSFLGTPGEGRLVWRQDQWGVPKPTSPEEVEKQRVIKGKLRRAEDTLVRFSIRIANWLAYWLVADYADNMMRSGRRAEEDRLTEVDVARAVVEILGDEWFELPFDCEGKLKSWKHTRDIHMTEATFIHIIRGN